MSKIKFSITVPKLKPKLKPVGKGGQQGKSMKVKLGLLKGKGSGKII